LVVTAYSAYSASADHPSVATEGIAWVLQSDPTKNRIGFVRPSALKPKDRYVCRRSSHSRAARVADCHESRTSRAGLTAAPASGER
jgi:hypothetical protein